MTIPTAKIIAFFKPYEVLCQFTDTQGRKTLKDFIQVPHLYAAGRLDYRSEGLLLLTNNGSIIHRITDPTHEHPKTYLVQMEGIVTADAINQLANEIVLPELQHKLPEIQIISPPNVPERSIPVRRYHPTTWAKITLREGKKHQIRRMTAAVGYPTLRLIRIAIGNIRLSPLEPGEWRWLKLEEVTSLLAAGASN